VIAVVNGHCIGGGLALAASCDIIFVSEHSTFSLPQVKVGAWGAGTFLMRLLGPMKIRALMMTGRTFSAQELAAGGCLEAVLPPEQLLISARALANEIAQHSGEALRAGKLALNGIELLDLKKSYRFEQGFTTELYISPEATARRQEHIDARFK
jgi:enoyl-CoA hydratase